MGLRIIEVPLGLHNTNTSNKLLDSLPILSMTACLPTLWLYHKHRRLLDLALFTLGFVLAVVYHCCHIHPEGLQASALMGASGPVWRTLDVLCAQWLLGRTWGHAIGARGFWPRAISNAVFPLGCTWLALTSAGDLPMEAVMQCLAAAVVLALAGKLASDGMGSLPKYGRRQGACMLGCFCAGFVSFFMPARYPRQYWLFHSVWHVLLAAGYYLLYDMIINTAEQQQQLQRQECEKPQPAAAQQLCTNSWVSRQLATQPASLQDNTDTESVGSHPRAAAAADFAAADVSSMPPRAASATSVRSL